MLVRINASPRRVDEGQLAVLAGGQVMCSDFRCPKLAEIFGEGEPAEYAYQITSGAVRTYKLLADGRRLINAFHLPGDLFGIENGELYRFTAEAVIDTTVSIVRRNSLLESAQQGLTTKLLGLITRNLQHAENHMLLLGRKTAIEKVAAFLLEINERLGMPIAMVLPMNRRDIADYLGLTLETVSRALSALRDRDLIRFTCASQRQLMLLDRPALAALQG